MFLGARVIVVVPAFEEAPRIGRVVGTLPDFVDHAVVVDDASSDGTAEAARAGRDPRVVVVRHEANRGVGAAIATGYRRALSIQGGPRDAFVVMAGDGQMDPDDLPGLVRPVALDLADYVKGDRFRSPAGARAMPIARRFGGKVFSWLTSKAIGVEVSDSQCGYTALARSACEELDLDDLWPGYGYPNDLLAQAARRGLRIQGVEVRAVYADEVSRLRPYHLAAITGLIARAWLRRVAVTTPAPAR